MLHSKKRKKFFKNFFSSIFMVQVVPVIHDSYVIFSLKPTMTVFAALSLYEVKSSVNGSVKRSFLIQVHLRPFTPTEAENGSHYPQEPALLREVHTEWPEWCGSLTSGRFPDCKSGVARCSSYLQPPTPGNQRAGEELEPTIRGDYMAHAPFLLSSLGSMALPWNVTNFR